MHYKLRRTSFLVISVFLSLSSVPVSAQENGEEPKVKRYALIIANQDYNADGVLKTGALDMPASGEFKDLKNPCRDAELFRDSLKAAKWQPDEINFAGCNLEAKAMRDLVTTFRQKISLSTNTLLVFYYSGHGAQFSDGETSHSFMFGVKAKLDLAAIQNSLVTSPGNTSAVAEQAVDLDELLSTIGTQFENAVLVVLDACRENPFYGQVNAAISGQGGDGNHVRITALSGARMNYTGVVLAYATPAGMFAGEGPGNHSIFTETLTTLMKRPTVPRLDDVLNDMSKSIARSYKIKYPDRDGYQPPAIDGRFTGRWCVWACPATADPAPIGSAVAANPPAFPVLMDLRLPQLAVAQVAGSAVSSAMPTSPWNLVQKFQAPIPTDAIAAPGMNIDVLVCVDGPGAEERLQRAEALAEKLAYEGRYEQSSPRAEESIKAGRIGDVTASVRLRRLTETSNTAAGLRYTGDVATVDLYDKTEAAWAERLRSRSSTPLEIAIGKGRTPGYVSVAICAAPQDTQAVATTAYLQVPSDRYKGSGTAMLKKLSALVPDIKPVAGIETVKNGPDRTELRYYFPEDRNNVFAAAKTLETLLERPVRIQYMPRLGTPASKGNMEIWLGKDEEPLPRTLGKS